jgi:hypothetical protein
MHGCDVVLIDAKRCFGGELAFQWPESMGELCLDRVNYFGG